MAKPSNRPLDSVFFCAKQEDIIGFGLTPTESYKDYVEKLRDALDCDDDEILRAEFCDFYKACKIEVTVDEVVTEK